MISVMRNIIVIDRHTWLIVPAIALLFVAFAYPVFWLLLRSFSEPVWGFQNYQIFFQKSLYNQVVWNTAAISGSVTAICLLIGYPVAYTMANTTEGIRRILIFIVLIPFWTSILVRTFAWMVMLQKQGIINTTLIDMGLIQEPLDLIYNRAGVLIGMVQVMLPFMIFPLYSVMTRIDSRYTEAASTLGAPPVRNFLRVYLPLSLPGVITGGMLVFIISLGYFITPALLGGRGDTMVSQMIQQRIGYFGDWGTGAALAVVLLVGTVICFSIVHWAVGRRQVWGN